MMIRQHTARKTQAILVIAIMNILSSVSISPAQELLMVRVSQIRCVVDHIENYLRVERDPLVIFLDLCPMADPSQRDIASLATNTLPTIARRQEQSPVSRVLVLRKSQVNCLYDQYDEVLRPVDTDEVTTGVLNDDLAWIDVSVCDQ